MKSELYYAKGNNLLRKIHEETHTEINPSVPRIITVPKNKVFPKPIEADSIVLVVDGANSIRETNELDNRAIISADKLKPNIIALKPELKSDGSISYGYELERAEGIQKDIKIQIFYMNGESVLQEIVSKQIDFNGQGSTFKTGSLTKEHLIPFDATSIRVVVDGDEKLSETNGVDNSAEIPIYFIQKVPRIMENIADSGRDDRGWEVAKNLIETWLYGAARVKNVADPRLDCALGVDKLLSLDWILNKNVDRNGIANTE